MDRPDVVLAISEALAAMELAELLPGHRGPPPLHPVDVVPAAFLRAFAGGGPRRRTPSLLTRDDLYALLPKLEEFHGRFGRYFPRSESRGWSRKYLVGLALPIERKNVENIAEQVGGSPRRLQEFLSDSPWNDEGCVEELQRLVGEELGADDGVLILDLTRTRDYPEPMAGRSPERL